MDYWYLTKNCSFPRTARIYEWYNNFYIMRFLIIWNLFVYKINWIKEKEQFINQFLINTNLSIEKSVEVEIKKKNPSLEHKAI